MSTSQGSQGREGKAQMATNAHYNVRIAATFLSRSETTALLTDHVSARGVFVRTDSPPPVMELLRIEFVLPPSSTTVVMHGMVTEIVLPQSKHSAPGVENRFLREGGEPGRLWDHFLRHVRERYPESASRPVTLAQEATDQVRRAHPRVVPATPIEVGSAHGSKSMIVGDISDGGMFIKTSESFTVGSDSPHHPPAPAHACANSGQLHRASAGIRLERRDRRGVSERERRAAGRAHGADMRQRCRQLRPRRVRGGARSSGAPDDEHPAGSRSFRRVGLDPTDSAWRGLLGHARRRVALCLRRGAAQG